MDRAFSSEEEAEEFVRETLRDAAHPADDSEPTWLDEVVTNLSDLHMDMYDYVKEWVKGIEVLDIGEVSALEHMVMWRDAVWYLGEERVRLIARECLQLSPEAELEKLIRMIGHGYHPDTPFDGYEPPITQYTEEEWNIIHTRFFQDRSQDTPDIYEFALPIQREMLAARVQTFPDGSRSDQVVMEEVRYELARYVSGLQCDEVLLELLSWSRAAQAAFADELRKIVD